MKLRAGLLRASSPWEQIFRQEGFPFGIIDAHHFNPDEWSVLVINRVPDEHEALILSGYLRNGGGILSCGGFGQSVLGTGGARARIEYITSHMGGLFEETGILDVGAECMVSREANQLRTDSGNNALFAGEWRGGQVVELPFDPAELMCDSRSTLRQFYSASERLPSENVSFVSKGELRSLFSRALEYLHHSRGLPYAHLWFFPEGAENCFAFRIDTDGAPQADVEDLYAVSREYEVPFSWYLDVKSHREWLRVFRAMQGQEIGVHCFEHKTFELREENVANMSRALELIKGEGMSASGFAAPYGEWNPGLAAAIDESGFLYSSEFSYAFDSFPLYPEANGRRFAAVQVPIHPVCIGSMQRVGYTTEQMTKYFHRSVQMKLCRREPLFYYHHPAHRCFDVVKALLDAAHSSGIPAMTLGEFARWWKIREGFTVDLETDGVSTRFAMRADADPGTALWVEVTTKGGLARRVPLSTRSVSQGEGEWKSLCRESPPHDVRRTREFDPRTRFAGWLNTILRKLR